MFPSRRTAVVSSATAVGLALVLAGCGGGQSSAAPAGTGSSSAAPTSTAPPTTSAATPSNGESAGVTPIPTPIMVSGRPIQYHGQQSVVGQKSVQVTMHDVYFQPSVLVGSPGQTVTVNVTNDGNIDHTFTISDQNVDVVLHPGKSAKVQVTFPQSNRTPFICRFHVAAGMAGILAVAP